MDRGPYYTTLGSAVSAEKLKSYFVAASGILAVRLLEIEYAGPWADEKDCTGPSEVRWFFKL